MCAVPESTYKLGAAVIKCRILYSFLIPGHFYQSFIYQFRIFLWYLKSIYYNNFFFTVCLLINNIFYVINNSAFSFLVNIRFFHFPTVNAAAFYFVNSIKICFVWNYICNTKIYLFIIQKLLFKISRHQYGIRCTGHTYFFLFPAYTLSLFRTVRWVALHYKYSAGTIHKCFKDLQAIMAPYMLNVIIILFPCTQYLFIHFFPILKKMNRFKILKQILQFLIFQLLPKNLCDISTPVFSRIVWYTNFKKRMIIFF